MSPVIDPGVLDSVSNSIVQVVARALVREGHRGGLGDSRPLRAAIRNRVSQLASEMIDPDILTLVSMMSGSIPEWVSFGKSRQSA
jgi:hypothetical protein